MGFACSPALRPPLVVLGGTFDPVHRTHIALALSARDALGAEVRLIPNADPPHRARPIADGSHRLAMLRLAVADQPGLSVDTRELERSGPSYMVDTLLSLRAEIGEQRSLCLLLGSDAFAGIARWHRWQRLVDVANLLIAIRPGADESLVMDTLRSCDWIQRQRLLEDVASNRSGVIVFLPMPTSEDSSTTLRAALASGSREASMLPAVAAYIDQHRLYR